MNRSLKFFLLFLLAVTTVNAKNNKNLFVGVNTGISFVNTEMLPNGNLNVNYVPEHEGANYGFEVGYRVGSNFFTTLNCNNYDFSEYGIKNYYLSLNYQFDIGTVQPYIGILVGKSKIKFNRELLTNSNQTKVDYDKYHKSYGAQLGLEKRLNNSVSVYGSYQFVRSYHRVAIEQNGLKPDVDFDKYQSFLIGIRYHF